jgi:hypothetical protein
MSARSAVRSLETDVRVPRSNVDAIGSARPKLESLRPTEVLYGPDDRIEQKPTDNKRIANGSSRIRAKVRGEDTADLT